MSQQRTELGKIGEFGLIDRLSKSVQLKNKSTQKGIGDDAAVMQYGNRSTVVSTDLLIENIHFDLIYTPLKHLGYKAVAVNVSDIYAMNARPTQITVSIAISNRFSVEAIEELYRGIHTACEHYGVDLVGGDTTSSLRGLVISITAIGVADADKIVYRSGAKTGDILCVTGDLGAAYLGLQVLEREKQVYLETPDMQPKLEEDDYIVGRLLKPEARKDIFEFFKKADIVPTSMLDISDGLSSDLIHLCRQSNVGALVEEAQVPIYEKTFQKALDFKFDPIICALHGGEDYELLFTISPRDLDKIRFQTEIKIIGEITPIDDGIQLHTKGGRMIPLVAQGWKHFQRDGDDD